jgi:hypothetical protein
MMDMKDNRTRNTVLGTVVFVLIVLVLEQFLSNNDIEITDVRWTVENKTCTVTFDAKNLTDIPVSASLRITAHEAKNQPYGIANRVVGEETMSLDLGAGEKRNCTHKFSFMTNRVLVIITITILP